METATLSSVVKGFYWCAINGEFEAYCMATLCATCPANKQGWNYDPDSLLVKTYQNLMESK